MRTNTIKQTWVNDHLDLLNYAKQIGDTAWQNEIIAALKNSETHLQEQAQYKLQFQLWQRFDQLNHRVLELYQQIRELGNEAESLQLQEKLWGLKIERVRVSQQLRTL
ncbi:hypothetical protein EBB07_24035 [Paenibacillaceae bacterium]|nr:hypothetical protein EBB07_24035 [Paenibacillaceae bacterium]